MHGPELVATVVLAVCAVITLLLTLGGLIFRRLGQAKAAAEKAVAQNEVQLEEQQQFKRDWKGEPARDGVPARPGMLQRLRTVEDTLTDVHRNTQGVPERMSQLEGRQGKVEEQLLDLGKRVTAIELDRR